MASANPRSPGRLKQITESIRKTPRALGKKLTRSRSLHTPKIHRRERKLVSQTSLDVSLDDCHKYVQGTPCVVVAIDFGTTYSGYAYAFTRSPDEIHLMRHSDAGHLGGVAVKMPTILLLNERGGFHSFGYEAREAYHDLEEAETRQWLYFEKFKMELHSRQVGRSYVGSSVGTCLHGEDYFLCLLVTIACLLSGSVLTKKGNHIPYPYPCEFVQDSALFICSRIFMQTW